MRNDNDRNPKDFYGKTEAELRKLKQTKGISQRDGNSLKNAYGKKTAGTINLRQYRTKIVRQMRRQIFRQMKQKAE